MAQEHTSRWRLAACAAFVCALMPSHRSVAQPDAVIASAVADSARPAADRERDLNRKPAEVLTFAGVKAGDKVGDYAAGQGYFTRLFSGAVGPQGHVYASVPSPLFKYQNIVMGIADIEAYTREHSNVSVIAASPIDAARYPEKLDLFFIAQNYHDLRDPFMGPVDMAAFNKEVFAALKSGGVYLVLDHVAATGSASDVADTLHRIEPAVVRREIEAAGFKFVAESKVLANPADPHDKGVFDESIRGKTDQFIFKFRKP